MGSGFISHILKATENEMDPRNILLVFDLIKFILNEFDTKILINYKNVIFEQLDLYYPIEFDENVDKRYTPYSWLKILDKISAIMRCLEWLSE